MHTDNAYIKRLTQIKELLNHPAVEKYSVAQKVKSIFRDLEYGKHIYNFNIPMLHRAVSNPKEEWFDKIDKFGIAPPQVAKLNRCNWAGEPMFYGSEDNAVPIFEIRAKKGEYIALSFWKNTNNLSGSYLEPIHIKGIAIGVEKIVEVLDDDDLFKKLLLRDDVFKTETRQDIKEIDRFVGDIFIESEQSISNLYLLTSAIAKVLFEDMYSGNDRLDGIIYPSVESNRTGTNVVLSKEYAKKNLELHAVSVFKVIDYSPAERRYILNPIKALCEIDENRKLKWRKIHRKYEGEYWNFTPNTPKLSFNEDNILDLEENCE